MIDHTAFQDTLNRVMEFWQVKKEINQLSAPEREKILGLKFTKGEVVRDTVTGQEVQIAGGIREIIGLPGPGG